MGKGARGLGSESVEGEGEVAAPEVWCVCAGGVDGAAELPDQDGDVGRRQIGA